MVKLGSLEKLGIKESAGSEHSISGTSLLEVGRVWVPATERRSVFRTYQSMRRGWGNVDGSIVYKMRGEEPATSAGDVVALELPRGVSVGQLFHRYFQFPGPETCSARKLSEWLVEQGFGMTLRRISKVGRSKPDVFGGGGSVCLLRWDEDWSIRLARLAQKPYEKPGLTLFDLNTRRAFPGVRLVVPDIWS